MAPLTAGETEATERLGNLLMATQLVMALPPLLAQACLCFHPPVHHWGIHRASAAAPGVTCRTGSVTEALAGSVCHHRRWEVAHVTR